MKKTQELTRRQFLGRALGAAAAFTIVPRHVLGGPGYTPPSEELTRAIIGVGNMGRGHIAYPGARLLAVCDVESTHLAEALKMAGEGVKGYRDWREVIARPDIDIVHIATPPHWHALMSIAAAEAGKDVWCEKPMTRTIGEGKRVVEAIGRRDRMFRLNTWFRFQSDFYGYGSTVAPIKKIVDSGLLGWPLTFTVGRPTGFNWKTGGWTGLTDLTPQPVPATLDYEMWLGPAPYKPWHPHRTAMTFRGYWDYDGGGLGDMAQHYLDPVQYLLGKDDESPVEVEADAPLQHPDAVGVWRRIELRYADGCKIVLDGTDQDSETPVPFISGPKGKLYKNLESDIPDLRRRLAALPESAPQVTDFSHSVRTRTKFALNELNGYRSCTLVNLAKTAVQLGRPLRFDSATQRFIDDEEANRLAEQPMRAPWHV